MRPLEHLRTHFSRDANQVRNDRDRNRRREFGDEVGRALSLENVDSLMREASDPRRERLDPARDEGAVDETPQPCVLGRLELENRMAFDRVERR